MSRATSGGATTGAVRSSESRAELYWKRGRAYLDAPAWEAWGGKQEALVPAGERHATRDQVTAAILCGERLAELRALRKAHPGGLVPAHGGDDPLDRIATFAGWYLAEKANRRGRKRVTDQWLAVQQQRLAHAARFFANRGCELLRDLGPAEVRAYMEDLRRNVPPRRDGRGSGGRGALSPITQRWYLDTLGELLQAAVAEGRIERNWVSERNDLPTADPSPTKHLEIWEAALLLEGARRLHPLHGGGPSIYPLLAFYLLMGVAESERAGVRVADVRLPGDPEFPGGAILVRPNKTVRQDRNQDQGGAAAAGVPLERVGGAVRRPIGCERVAAGRAVAEAGGGARGAAAGWANRHGVGASGGAAGGDVLLLPGSPGGAPSGLEGRQRTRGAIPADVAAAHFSVRRVQDGDGEAGGKRWICSTELSGGCGVLLRPALNPDLAATSSSAGSFIWLWAMGSTRAACARSGAGRSVCVRISWTNRFRSASVVRSSRP